MLNKHLKNIGIIVIFLISLVGIGFICKYKFKNFFTPSEIYNVGICCGEPPYEYLDKNGKIAGINKELINIVLKKMNIKKSLIHWHVMPFSEAFLALDLGKIDVLATVLYVSPERQERYDFAKISSSYLVFINKNREQNEKKGAVCYGLHGDSVFEKEAKLRGLRYKGYNNAADVLMNFDLDKVNGISVDVKTLKDLIIKNYPNICSPIEVLLTVQQLEDKKFFHIRNPQNLLENTPEDRKICGMLSWKHIKLASPSHILRVYHKLEDLILAFRAAEVEEIIVPMEDYKNFNNLMDLSVKVENPQLFQWLGVNKMMNLQLRISKNLLIIVKKNSNSTINNKKYGMLIENKQLSDTLHGEFEVVIYKDIPSVFIGLCTGVIDGIIIQNLPLKDISVFCNIANLKIRGAPMFNGFAFRKIAKKTFDHQTKMTMIKTIEEEALKHHALREYEEIPLTSPTELNSAPTDE
jgi:hypothetical protein